MAFRLWQYLADKHGVEAFEVGEDDELLQRGVVADVPFGTGVGLAPLFGGLAEEGDVEQVRFAGIEGNVLVGVAAATVTPSFGLKSDGTPARTTGVPPVREETAATT